MMKLENVNNVNLEIGDNIIWPDGERGHVAATQRGGTRVQINRLVSGGTTVDWFSVGELENSGVMVVAHND